MIVVLVQEFLEQHTLTRSHQSHLPIVFLSCSYHVPIVFLLCSYSGFLEQHTLPYSHQSRHV
jgi:hypothetical protein